MTDHCPATSPGSLVLKSRLAPIMIRIRRVYLAKSAAEKITTHTLARQGEGILALSSQESTRSSFALTDLANSSP